MFAHVVARTIGVVHRYSLENALVLGNGVPQIAASLGRQALTFEKNTGKGMGHVDQKLVAGSSQQDGLHSSRRYNETGRPHAGNSGLRSARRALRGYRPPGSQQTRARSALP